MLMGKVVHVCCIYSEKHHSQLIVITVTFQAWHVFTRCKSNTQVITAVPSCPVRGVVLMLGNTCILTTVWTLCMIGHITAF